MEENKKIIKTYKEKIRFIKKHNKHYYSEDKPRITDAEYDNFKSEILALEKKYNFLQKLNLSKGLVGSSPSKKFNKIDHLKPMLSLSNAFDKKDMEDFLKKLARIIPYLN